MDLQYQRRRFADFAAALKLTKRVAERDTWSADRLHAHQQERAREIVRHAARNSPFYRARLGRHGGDTPFEEIEPVDKSDVMESYDSLVTDPRLRRDALLEYVDGMQADGFYPGGYRVMATSGSSGRKGLFVYDRDGWRAILAQFLRQGAITGVAPRIPRWRLCGVVGLTPSHMSRQCTATLGVGVHQMLPLPMTLPLEAIVTRLNEYKPQYLNVYPSMGALLADEQEAGRLRLELEVLTTSSDLCTPGIAERLTDVFGVRPHNMYASTEGLWGLNCESHDGIHLYEDMTLVENVDEDDRPVAPGEPGARLLVTNLSNRVQPIIRLRLPDVMTFAPEPCSCGRPFVLARSIDGRSDDVLKLPGRHGEVTVLPIHFAVVSRDRDVREFQVVQQGALLRVRVVPRWGASVDLDARLVHAVRQRLSELGVSSPQVIVQRCVELPRTAGGKLKLVTAAARTTVSV